MTGITLTLLAIALAMDAFAVSIATGMSLKKVNWKQTLRMALAFGFFQALMPLIGWWVGLSLSSFVRDYDHWIAFILLALIGGHMIREAGGAADETETKDPTQGLRLLILAIATSIDALAAGLSFSLLKTGIVEPILVIGIMAFLFTALGLHLGKVVGNLPGISTFAERFGGLTLILIGVKILREHGAMAW